MSHRIIRTSDTWAMHEAADTVIRAVDGAVGVVDQHGWDRIADQHCIRWHYRDGAEAWTITALTYAPQLSITVPRVPHLPGHIQLRDVDPQTIAGILTAAGLPEVSA